MVPPMHEAAFNNDVEALRQLLDAGPQRVNDDRGGEGRAPLHYACQAGSLEAVQLLLDRGADIDQRDHFTISPIQVAAWSGRVEAVSYLLSRGADPTPQEHDQSTALTLASMGEPGPGSDYVAVLRMLLKDGRVPVDARDDETSTALHQACSWGYAERARVLLAEGRADRTVTTISGETAMDKARRRGHEDCIRVFEWYDGELEKPCLLAKARAVADARECISKAAEKAGARTEAEAQRAMEEAAPAYLRGRVKRGEALPVVEVEGQGEEECVSVLEYVVHELTEDLVVEMMEGLQLR